jgi:phosphonate transport system substrate-binding protein
MTTNLLKKTSLGLSLLILYLFQQNVYAETYSFSVVPLRSALLTAQYWNPILDYVGSKAGVTLELKVARSVTENAMALEQGVDDFHFSYLVFRPKVQLQKYRVILKPRSGDVRSQIVVLANSPIKLVKELDGREVGFPSKSGFIAYALPMDFLLREKIAIKPVFGGNQEGVLGQLKAGQVVAVGVSSQVMKAFSVRENLPYKVLWESSPNSGFPISVHPRVPKEIEKKIQAAFISMSNEVEGMKVLEASALIIGQKPPHGFVRASNKNYRQLVEFYKTTLVKDLE